MFLEHHGVTKWYDKRSLVPIRYLGFHMVQSPAQRHLINDRLLQQMSNACTTFSHRQLSLRGRVVVANSLILSKLWYQLRVNVPPQSFFNKLRSTIYQFVTKGCHPSIGYSVLCLPRQQGGLGLLDARFCHTLIHHHLTLLPDNQLGSRLPCFFKPLRQGPLCGPLTFLRRIFEVFDGFAWTPDTSTLSPATWLRLPLTQAISHSPGDYWIHGKHNSDPISIFFCFDPDVGCLRPLIPHQYIHSGPRDHIQHRNLSARLLRDILSRSITLDPAFSRYITTWDHQPGTIDDTPVISAFLNFGQWKTFRAQAHRQRLLVTLPPSRPPPTLNLTKWNLFWTTSMHLNCRNLWYRLLLGKLYCQDSLSRSTPARPGGCHLCSSDTESLHHLFVLCPIKWNVWLHTFSFFLPSLPLSPSLVISWILDLSPPDTTTWMLCSCLLQVIWRQHWAHLIHHHPFSPASILSTVISQFSLLRPPPHIYYVDP